MDFSRSVFKISQVFLSQGCAAGLLLVTKPGIANVLVALTEASGNLVSNYPLRSVVFRQQRLVDYVSIKSVTV